MEIDKYFHMYGTKDEIIFEEVEKPEEGGNVTFWKKRDREYEDMISVLVAEQSKGVKIDSIEITGEGIIFKKSQPERKKGKWIGKSGSLHYCSECGWALMDSERGEPTYMGIGYNRENPERWMCCPGWNEWLMSFCPNCGADMRGEPNEID